jgi:hypothetical protein
MEGETGLCCGEREERVGGEDGILILPAQVVRGFKVTVSKPLV